MCRTQTRTDVSYINISLQLMLLCAVESLIVREAIDEDTVRVGNTTSGHWLISVLPEKQQQEAGSSRTCHFVLCSTEAEGWAFSMSLLFPVLFQLQVHSQV